MVYLSIGLVEKSPPHEGGGASFPSTVGRVAICKVSWLLLSLKHGRCKVSGAYFPRNSTMEEASHEVSLTWTYIDLFIKHQMHASKYWEKWPRVRRLRNALLKAHQVWLKEKNLERVKRGFQCSLFFQGQCYWLLVEPDEKMWRDKIEKWTCW